MDPLEDVFSAMRVESALYARLEANAPWGISFEVSDAARFAIVVRGHCWLSGNGLEKPIALAGGDCFIVKGEDEFLLQDDLSSLPRNCEEVFASMDEGAVTVGGTGALTEIVAGRFTFDATGGEPLMSVLPSILHIRMDTERTHLLKGTLQLLAMETTEQSLGSKVVVNRLADILFLQAVRAYCISESGLKPGWLAALTDKHLSKAISALHENIGNCWTVDSLAKVAGMSRSAFAERFRAVAGDTPINYLTRWRIYRAKALLSDHGLSLSQIAGSVGYETDSAFNRAFKRAEGLTPGEFRRRQRQQRSCA